MKRTGLYLFRSMQWLTMGAMAWSCAPALAGSAADAAATYQRERAVCLSGQSNQDRETCLREAGAALAQSRKNGTLDDDTAFQQNAQRRCDPLPSEDRRACLARMQGQGSTSGSVSGGGIYRELITVEPAAPDVAKPGAVTPTPLPR